MRAVAPVLHVRDVVRAHDYYAEKLGFRSPRMWGDPPVFCIPQRDGLALMLSQIEQGAEVRPIGWDENDWSAYFWVEDADALHAEFKAGGADISREPQDKVYGTREFEIRDLDGHVLAFGHDTTGVA